jgi:hypothetical protein
LILDTIFFTSSISAEYFDILDAEKVEAKKFFVSSSLCDIDNNETPLCFMITDESVFFLGFSINYEKDGKAKIVFQHIMDDFCLFRIPEKTEPFFSDNASNPIRINSYILVRSHDEKAEIWAKINKRLAYLDEAFDEDEYKEKYHSTKQLLLDVLQCLKVKKYPFIGIDDNGQIGAEWHDGNGYKIISIIPRHNDNISVSCIKKSGIMLHMGTTLAQISSNCAKELSVPLGELPW